MRFLSALEIWFYAEIDSLNELIEARFVILGKCALLRIQARCGKEASTLGGDGTTVVRCYMLICDVVSFVSGGSLNWKCRAVSHDLKATSIIFENAQDRKVILWRKVRNIALSNIDLSQAQLNAWAEH